MLRRGEIIAVDRADRFDRFPHPYVQAFLRGEVPEEGEEEP
jgi:ABC-type transporter Mla maintaining outer membrane lipid asymmetry ATPase subunit MlaF